MLSSEDSTWISADFCLQNGIYVNCYLLEIAKVFTVVADQNGLIKLLYKGELRLHLYIGTWAM